MWHSITELKDKYRNKEAVIVGTGPGAYNLQKIPDSFIKIAINRAIILAKDYELLFVDSIATLKLLDKYLINTKYISMPVWSRETLNINTLTGHEYQIYLSCWVYDCLPFLVAPNYSLNDFCLYIRWGTVQPALHACKLLGFKSVLLLGFEGQEVNGQMNAKKILERFGINKQRKQRTLRDYKFTRQHLEKMARVLRFNISYWKNE